MPRGDKSKYTAKTGPQSRAYRRRLRKRGVPENEAKRRAWATVNLESGGVNLAGSGRGMPDTKVASKKGGRIGGAIAAKRPASAGSR